MAPMPLERLFDAGTFHIWASPTVARRAVHAQKKKAPPEPARFIPVQLLDCQEYMGHVFEEDNNGDYMAGGGAEFCTPVRFVQRYVYFVTVRMDGRPKRLQVDRFGFESLHRYIEDRVLDLWRYGLLLGPDAGALKALHPWCVSEFGPMPPCCDCPDPLKARDLPWRQPA